jgi:hypothetical protein
MFPLGERTRRGGILGPSGCSAHGIVSQSRVILPIELNSI